MKSHIPQIESPILKGCRSITGILILGLALRLAAFAFAYHHSAGLAVTHTPDTHTYLEPARALYRSGEFARDGTPELVRTPGYPLLLIPGVALGHVELVTIALQILLSVATIGLVARLTLSVTGNRLAATVAGLLLAIEPLSIAYASYLLAETLFTFLLVLAVVLLVGHFRSGGTLSLAAAGGLIAAATLVRPVGYYLAPLIVLGMAARLLFQDTSRGRRALQAMAFAAATLAPLAAWHARNNAVAGYGGFSAIADWNLYFYQGVSILAQQRHQSLETLQAELGCVDNELFFRLHPELLIAGQAAKFRYLHAEGARLVRDNPLVYAKIHLRGLAMLALNPGATDLLKLVGQHVQSSGLSTVRGGPLGSAASMLRNAPTTFLANLALAGTLAIVYGLACIGIWPSLRQPSWQSALVGLLILALFGMAGGPACVARMRHPIMPLVCVFAGLGAVEVRKRFAGRLGNRHGESHRISASNVPARTRQAA